MTGIATSYLVIVDAMQTMSLYVNLYFYLHVGG